MQPVHFLEPIRVGIPEAARLLAVTIWRMRVLIWEGKIPADKDGGRAWTILLEDLRAYAAHRLNAQAV